MIGGKTVSRLIAGILLILGLTLTTHCAAIVYFFLYDQWNSAWHTSDRVIFIGVLSCECFGAVAMLVCAGIAFRQR